MRVVLDCISLLNARAPFRALIERNTLLPEPIRLQSTRANMQSTNNRMACANAENALMYIFLYNSKLAIYWIYYIIPLTLPYHPSSFFVFLHHQPPHPVSSVEHNITHTSANKRMRAFYIIVYLNFFPLPFVHYCDQAAEEIH